MKLSRFLLASLALLLVCSTAQAQFGKRLGKAIENAAKNATVRKAEQKTEEAVSKTIDKATDPDTYKDKDDNNVETPDSDVSTKQPQQGAKAAEMAYVKSDFVAGDEIIFSDDLANEQLGEFPSMWDLKRGNAEIATVGGENAIHMEKETLITPFMKEKDYLPDVFTVEFDLFIPEYKGLGLNSRYNIDLVNAAGKTPFQIYFYMTGSTITLYWNWLNGGESNSGNVEKFPFSLNKFNHFAISFNKRAMKAYVNGERFVNIPRCDAPTRFQIYSDQGAAADNRFIKNVRIAKGAVPLYDRMMTDGKIITYGITFDIGKSTIKPESMGEINRIAKLMQDNPGLKFSVEGHTDNTGSAATNQTLSGARSSAVVAKLVEMGVAKDRLKSAGKGQNSPIADNSTDEGRAKNRRVEFVKI